MLNQTRQPRAVVASLGAITAQGGSADDLWSKAKDGTVAISEVDRLPMEEYRTRIAGEVKDQVIPRNRAGYPDKWRDLALDFALVAAEEAMSAADYSGIDPTRWGLVLGTCNAGLLSAEQWYLQRQTECPVDPKVLQFVTPQGIAEALAGVYGIKGPVVSVNTACAAGANAIGYAAEMIRLGQVDAVLTGGTDALSDVLIAGFNSLESLSPRPAAPYSADRTGLSLGEGSGMMVLVSEEFAHERGLPVIAQFGGLGLSADGYHPTAPQPEGKGAARAIRESLRQAGISARDVAYINSHGTGTAKNDPAETMAMRRGLGDALDEIRVSSTKSVIGHLLGAAGACEAIVTVKALEESIAPPTANFTTPDPECDLRHVPNEAQFMDGATTVMCNNFAFGGANASLVFTKDAPDGRMPLADERIFVTGTGAVSCAGVGMDTLWSAFTSGEDRTTAEEGHQIGRFDCDGKTALTPKARRRMDRLGIVSVVTAREALDSAGLEISEANQDRIGPILGTGIGPMDSMERFAAPLFSSGASSANPAVFPNTVYNAATGQVAMNLGLLGPTSTLTGGHAAGAMAFTSAVEEIRRGSADAMVAIGADTLTETVRDAYADLGILGQGAFALSEAGAGLVLESESGLRGRGATPVAEVLGYALASDGLGAGEWDAAGAGVARAMQLALERAGVDADEVVRVWSGSCGIPSLDRAEARAISEVLGNRVDVVSSRTLLCLSSRVRDCG